MQVLHVKTGKEMMMVIIIITCVHYYINVQPLHLTPMAFTLPKGLSGMKRKGKPGLSRSQQQHFICKEAPPRL